MANVLFLVPPCSLRIFWIWSRVAQLTCPASHSYCSRTSMTTAQRSKDMVTGIFLEERLGFPPPVFCVCKFLSQNFRKKIIQDHPRSIFASWLISNSKPCCEDLIKNPKGVLEVFGKIAASFEGTSTFHILVTDNMLQPPLKMESFSPILELNIQKSLKPPAVGTTLLVSKHFCIFWPAQDPHWLGDHLETPGLGGFNTQHPQPARKNLDLSESLTSFQGPSVLLIRRCIFVRKTWQHFWRTSFLNVENIASCWATNSLEYCNLQKPSNPSQKSSKRKYLEELPALV